MAATIYKICHCEDWAALQGVAAYAGSPKDREDGFIHFSLAGQLPGTLARWYGDAAELVLLAVDGAALGPDLKYEPSRDGALFPHLYGQMPLSAVLWAKTITKGADGIFVLPAKCSQN